MAILKRVLHLPRQLHESFILPGRVKNAVDIAILEAINGEEIDAEKLLEKTHHHLDALEEWKKPEGAALEVRKIKQKAGVESALVMWREWLQSHSEASDEEKTEKLQDLIYKEVLPTLTVEMPKDLPTRRQALETGVDLAITGVTGWVAHSIYQVFPEVIQESIDRGIESREEKATKKATEIYNTSQALLLHALNFLMLALEKLEDPSILSKPMKAIVGGATKDGTEALNGLWGVVKNAASGASKSIEKKTGVKMPEIKKTEIAEDAFDGEETLAAAEKSIMEVINNEPDLKAAFELVTSTIDSLKIQIEEFKDFGATIGEVGDEEFDTFYRELAKKTAENMQRDLQENMGIFEEPTPSQQPESPESPAPPSTDEETR